MFKLALVYLVSCNDCIDCIDYHRLHRSHRLHGLHGLHGLQGLHYITWIALHYHYHNVFCITELLNYRIPALQIFVMLHCGVRGTVFTVASPPTTAKEFGFRFFFSGLAGFGRFAGLQTCRFAGLQVSRTSFSSNREAAANTPRTFYRDPPFLLSLPCFSCFNCNAFTIYYLQTWNVDASLDARFGNRLVFLYFTLFHARLS